MTEVFPEFDPSKMLLKDISWKSVEPLHDDVLIMCAAKDLKKALAPPEPAAPRHVAGFMASHEFLCERLGLPPGSRILSATSPVDQLAVAFKVEHPDLPLVHQYERIQLVHPTWKRNEATGKDEWVGWK